METLEEKREQVKIVGTASTSGSVLKANVFFKHLQLRRVTRRAIERNGDGLPKLFFPSSLSAL